jgi:hypothetical protein
MLLRDAQKKFIFNRGEKIEAGLHFRYMISEIDEVIDSYGGWPGAFQEKKEVPFQ